VEKTKKADDMAMAGQAKKGLADYKTWDLVSELSKREGVETADVAAGSYVEIAGTRVDGLTVALKADRPAVALILLTPIDWPPI
jgi:hypothetical protein